VADGYFSVMDIYLPEHDVAVEFDGPTHYTTTSGASSSRDASTTRTAKTELRDVFLAKQRAKVVMCLGLSDKISARRRRHARRT
jgi:hypothetical protein